MIWNYTHVWKWDSNNYGGVTLLPKTKSEGTKEVNKVVCKKHLIFYIQKHLVNILKIIYLQLMYGV
jgi:hypothetical protein